MLSTPTPFMAAETSSHATQEQEATALFNKGVKLDHLHRYDEALAAYNELITRFGNSQNLTLQQIVAKARHNLSL
ncbi:MAG: tetratricopeptide repeat protein [Acetobacter sp.]|nr:tetratricopeptide repeat protein [Acetobacter sp.]MBQ5773411.1 tetratricopeptide repeat protein [Acetobacter sp.]